MRAARSERNRWPKAARAAARAPLRLVSGLGAMVTTGTLLLMLPAMSTGDPLRWNEALFTAASALSVTGLSIIVPFSDLTLAGKLVLLLLIQIGGVGYMVLAVLLLRFIGRHISLVDKLALRDSLGLVSHEGILELIYRVLAAVLLIEGVGAILLGWHWHNLLPADDLLLYSVFHSISAFCNAGFDLFWGRPVLPDAVPTDDGSLIILGTLIFLGSLGIPVLFDAVTWYRRRWISLHTRITLPLAVGLVVIGGLAMVLSEGYGNGVLAGQPLGRKLLMGVFQAVSARTAGFAGLPGFDHLEPSTELVLMMLMFIGSAPASMGGGITTGTFAVLGLALIAYAKGWSTPKLWGRAIPGEIVRKAAAVLSVGLVVVFFSTWLLLMTHSTTVDVALFEVTSAFATCGLSVGLTPDLNILGQLVIIFVMFWGRLGALTIMVAVTRPQRSLLVNYPEEKILIG